jgi:hypothetical protein
VDWDRIVVEKRRPYERFEIALDDALGFTREQTASLFASDAQEGSPHENP